MSVKAVPKDTYCHAAQGHEFHGPYHDDEYGFPIRGNDNALFERLLLEINQAGLSWLTILKKRRGLVAAYHNCDIPTVAAYSTEDEERLRNDDRVIRNKLKIKAAIYNAQRILEMDKTHGSFEAWLNAHHPRSKPEWVKLFRKTFKFTGGEVTGEFLISLGYLPGAHHVHCNVAKRILRENPPWMSAPRNFYLESE
jgi:DNA-3-methyladenine glycosylase I